jgi:magnesium chelatase family protein
LPIAVGVLAASQQVWPDKLEGCLFIGELSLDGSTRHTKGILPLAALARDEGFDKVFVPAVDAEEAALLPDIDVYPVTLVTSPDAHPLGRGSDVPKQPGSRSAKTAHP